MQLPCILFKLVASYLMVYQMKGFLVNLILDAILIVFVGSRSFLRVVKDNSLGALVDCLALRILTSTALVLN